MQLFYQPQLQDGIHYLNPDESRHCVKVLRLKTNDNINIIDGKGSLYRCAIIESNPKKCTFKIQSVKRENQKPYHLHIAITPTKNIDRLEWFVEKAVEIGVDEISFLLCEQSERRQLKLERLQRKVISAVKQSVKLFVPVLNEMCSFEEFVKTQKIDQKFIAYVSDENKPHLFIANAPAESALVLIGPEGDFSQREIDFAIKQGYTGVSLGKSRLRTETAGIAAIHTLVISNDK